MFCLQGLKLRCNFAPVKKRKHDEFRAKLTLGKMVEWSITPVLKTGVPRGTGGSNPSLSANEGNLLNFQPVALIICYLGCSAFKARSVALTCH